MKDDDLRRRAWSIRTLCILRPIVHLDAFNDLPVALVKRFGLRLSEDLLCIYALERKLGQGYQWKLALSKPNGFQSVPKTSKDLELAAVPRRLYGMISPQSEESCSRRRAWLTLYRVIFLPRLLR